MHCLSTFDSIVAETASVSFWALSFCFPLIAFFSLFCFHRRNTNMNHREVRSRDNPSLQNQEGRMPRCSSWSNEHTTEQEIDLTSNEHTTKQEVVSKRRTGKDSNEPFNDHSTRSSTPTTSRATIPATQRSHSQIMPATEKSDHATCSAEHSVAWSVDGRKGDGATFYIMVVVFHVMVVIYGMARVVSAFAFFEFFLHGFRLQAIAIPFASDGRCGQYSAPRALCTRKHVLACGSRS